MYPIGALRVPNWRFVAQVGHTALYRLSRATCRGAITAIHVWVHLLSIIGNLSLEGKYNMHNNLENKIIHEIYHKSQNESWLAFLSQNEPTS